MVLLYPRGFRRRRAIQLTRGRNFLVHNITENMHSRLPYTFLLPDDPTDQTGQSQGLNTRQSTAVGCDDHTGGGEEPAEAAPVTASSQTRRDVGDRQISRFSGDPNDSTEQEDFADVPPRGPMAHDGTERRSQGYIGIEKESPAVRAEFRRHWTPGPSRAEEEESGPCDGKEESPRGEALSHPLSEDGVSEEHISERRSAAVVVDEGGDDPESNGNNTISITSRSKARRQPEAESSRAAGVATAPTGAAREEMSPTTGYQRPGDDVIVKDIREELDKTMPADQAPPPVEETEEYANHTDRGGEQGRAEEFLGEPKADGTNGYGGEREETVEDEVIGTRTRNESHVIVVGDGIPHDDEASADAMSFVKDDDVSGSDDEFGKGVANYVGDHQQRQGQGQRRRQSSEGGERAQKNGRAERGDETGHGEVSAVQPFSRSAYYTSTFLRRSWYLSNLSSQPREILDVKCVFTKCTHACNYAHFLLCPATMLAK